MFCHDLMDGRPILGRHIHGYKKAHFYLRLKEIPRHNCDGKDCNNKKEIAHSHPFKLNWAAPDFHINIATLRLP
jgi:hypothetical protein